GVERRVAAGVGATVESRPVSESEGGLRIGLLGSFAVQRGGKPLALPASRKLRGLLAYLALAPQPPGRSRLCEPLWGEGASDPRGELRWCLSRLRSLLDAPARRRVQTGDDVVWLALDDCFVDVFEVERATADGLEALAPGRLREIAALFRGDLLEGIAF